MSFYFSIIGTKDNPLFEQEFGTSKQGGDGVSRFTDTARSLNPFIVHASLDILDEVQWGSGSMYLRTIDRFQTSHVSAFLTGGNVKFMLLSSPDVPASGSTAASLSTGQSASASSNRLNRAFQSFNPTSPDTEEAIKKFFLDVYDVWVKALMNPFYQANAPVTSPVFRQRVQQAARKHL